MCDFGFAKMTTDRTYTRCGTPDYTAPEMLVKEKSERGYSFEVDIWSLGVAFLVFPRFS